MDNPSRLDSLEGDEAKLYFCLHGENYDNLSDITTKLRISYDLAEHMVRKFKKMGILAEIPRNGIKYYYFRYETD